MTLPSRHRTRNSSPGGLRPSTLPLGHGGSPQYWLSHVHGEETFFVSFEPPRPGTEPRTLAWKAAVLTTTPGPPPILLRWLECFRGRRWIKNTATEWLWEIVSNLMYTHVLIINSFYYSRHLENTNKYGQSTLSLVDCPRDCLWGKLVATGKFYATPANTTR